MKFMELDEAGFIHHILDDPCITMIPVVNRFGYLPPKTNEQGHVLSRFGYRLLGTNPTEHLAHLLPRPISTEHWDLIINTGGISGYDNKNNDKTAWHFKWDEKQQMPVKFYYNQQNFLPAPQLTNNSSQIKKPCSKCPQKNDQTK